VTGTIVVENLLYVCGALAGILIGALVVTLRHRRPTSIEAHVALFHKGLDALAPDSGTPGSGGRRRPAVPRPPAVVPRPVRSVRAVPPPAAPAPTATEAETV